MALITTTVDVFAGVTSTGDVVLTPTGDFAVFSGGIISNTVVADVGYTAINGGGTAIGTTLEDYATQGVEAGTAIGTLVAADGLEFVV